MPSEQEPSPNSHIGADSDSAKEEQREEPVLIDHFGRLIKAWDLSHLPHLRKPPIREWSPRRIERTDSSESKDEVRTSQAAVSGEANREATAISPEELRAEKAYRANDALAKAPRIEKLTKDKELSPVMLSERDGLLGAIADLDRTHRDLQDRDDQLRRANASNEEFAALNAEYDKWAERGAQLNERVDRFCRVVERGEELPEEVLGEENDHRDLSAADSSLPPSTVEPVADSSAPEAVPASGPEFEPDLVEAVRTVKNWLDDCAKTLQNVSEETLQQDALNDLESLKNRTQWLQEEAGDVSPTQIEKERIKDLLFRIGQLRGEITEFTVALDELRRLKAQTERSSQGSDSSSGEMARRSGGDEGGIGESANDSPGPTGRLGRAAARVREAWPRRREASEVPQEEDFAARAHQKARSRIESLERDLRRDLTEDEKRIIYAEQLLEIGGVNINGIDRRTAELYRDFEGKAKSGKLRRALGRVGMVLGTGAAGATLRTGLHAVGVTWAGAIGGSIIGGVAGGLRGYGAERARQLGAMGYRGEYEKIKQDSGSEEALVFLESVLQDSKKFHGRHGELLELLTLYRKEASELVFEKAEKREAAESTRGIDLEGRIALGEEHLRIDDNTIESVLESLNLEHGRTLAEGYRTSPEVRRALRKAAFWGAVKGAAAGAVVGGVSDFVNWYVHHHGAAAAIAPEAHPTETLPDHVDAGKAWDYHNQQLPESALPTHQEIAAGLDEGAKATDYGNALRHAVYMGIREGKLDLPDGVSQHNFLHALNFAQPLEAHDLAHIPVGHGTTGGVYHFDEKGLQDLIGHVTHGGKIDYDAVLDADRWMSAQRVGEELALETQRRVAEEATRAASRAAAEAAAPVVSSAGEQLAPSVLAGAGAALGGEWAGRRGRAPIEAVTPTTPVAGSGGTRNAASGGETGGSGANESLAPAPPLPVPSSAPAELESEQSLPGTERASAPEELSPSDGPERQSGYTEELSERERSQTTGKVGYEKAMDLKKESLTEEKRQERIGEFAKLVLNYISNWQELISQTGDHDAQFRELARRAIREKGITVHNKGPSGESATKTDLDGRTAVGILALAGGLSNLSPESFTRQSSKIPERINVDTGDIDGFRIGADGTIVIDHHTPGTPQVSSAAEMTYVCLDALGLVEEQDKPWLGKLVDFVTKVDSGDFQHNFLRQSIRSDDPHPPYARSLLGVQHLLGFEQLSEFFKQKIAANPDFDPVRYELTDTDLSALGVAVETVAEREKEIEGMEARFKELEEQGLVVDTAWGKALIDVRERDGGPNWPLGFLGAAAFDCPVYIIWNPGSRSFMVSINGSKNPRLPRWSQIEERGFRVKNVRGHIFVGQRVPETVTREKLLAVLGHKNA